jgi:hypothetical protein
VYNKGPEHTSNCFHWTAEYAYEINELRKSAIPSDKHKDYLSDMLDDRLSNLFAVAICEPQKKWRQSMFYQDILSDMKKLNRRFSIKQRLFLILPHQLMKLLFLIR